MAHWLKREPDASVVAQSDRAVRETVEGILADIASRGAGAEPTRA